MMNVFRKSTPIDLQPPFDASQLEDEVRELIPTRRQVPAQVDLAPQMTVEEMCRISAEAVEASYKATVATLEELGEELRNNMRAIEQLTVTHDDTMKDIAETIKLYRERGQKAAQQIEQSSQLNAKARAMCVDLRREVEGQ